MDINRNVRRLDEHRVLYINGPIDDETAFEFNTQLLMMEHEDRNADITVYINSLGGSVSAGLSMIDTINLVSCDVSTVCVGMAASMGALILMSGTKGKRKILPHSSVLIHQPLSGFSGLMQASDVEIASRNLCRVKRTVYEMIADFTGKDIVQIEKDCDRDYTLYSQEAVDYGIVDSILKEHRKSNNP